MYTRPDTRINCLSEILLLRDFSVLCDWEGRVGYDGRTDRSGDFFCVLESMCNYVFVDVDSVEGFGVCRDMLKDGLLKPIFMI
jgi:hypothetical protein